MAPVSAESDTYLLTAHTGPEVSLTGCTSTIHTPELILVAKTCSAVSDKAWVMGLLLEPGTSSVSSNQRLIMKKMPSVTLFLLICNHSFILQRGVEGMLCRNSG
jgi:hypothetical protein